MVKRTQRASPRSPPRRPPQDHPAWPLQSHSGEGSASALEVLRKLEQQQRIGRRGDDPPPEEGGPR